MFELFTSRNGILARQRLLSILKEVFRKSIHLCSAFIPLLLVNFYTQTLICLTVIVVLYSIAEILRLKGKEVFLVSAITEAAARKRDENKFVLGPVTLVCGIIITSLLWNPIASEIGIYALAFGDGLASLSGKLFGRVHIPFTSGKTVAGSLTCFFAIFVSCFLVCYFHALPNVDITKVSLIIASVGMLIEVLPLKDFDNILIPVLLGGLAQLLLN